MSENIYDSEQFKNLTDQMDEFDEDDRNDLVVKTLARCFKALEGGETVAAASLLKMAHTVDSAKTARLVKQIPVAMHMLPTAMVRKERALQAVIGGENINDHAGANIDDLWEGQPEQLVRICQSYIQAILSGDAAHVSQALSALGILGPGLANALVVDLANHYGADFDFVKNPMTTLL